MIAITPAGISGAQHAITPARSALLRSGAGRSGWPILQGVKVPLYALSNIARSNATRSNYTSARAFVSIGGIQIGSAPSTPGAKILGDLSITDILNDTPNRATFKVRNLAPTIGQDVIVTFGSIHNGDRVFAGQILSTQLGYTGTPANYAYDVVVTDWTWGLNRYTVIGRWLATSATRIAQEILAQGAPGYTAAHVAPGLEILDEFTVTNQTVTQALSQLAKRIGGYWYVDAYKDLHLFLEETLEITHPTPLTAVHATLQALTVAREGGQLVTRVQVEGGGSAALTEVPIGETRIPIGTAAWYDPAGGTVIAGPQRIRYAGRAIGGGGGLVGPGASPSAVPTVTLAPGAGIETGVHRYAIAFLTATGSSLLGPSVAITCGLVPPPTEAPTVQDVAGVGAGPDPGLHDYAISYLTATGETLPGPRITVGTGTTAAPASAPAASVSAGPGVDPGSHEYACTFLTAAGETLAGPIGPGATASVITVSVADALAVGIAGNGPNASQGDLTIGHNYDYAAVYTTGASSGDFSAHTAVTTPSVSAMVQALASTSGGGKASPIVVNVPYSPSAAATFVHLYRRNRTTQTGDVSSFRLHSSYANSAGAGVLPVTDTIADSAIASRPAPSSTNNTAASTTYGVIAVSSLPKGDATVTGRKLYRRSGGAGLRLVTTIANNSSTTYTDTAPNASLGAAPPAIASALRCQLPLAIPLPPAGTTLITGRRVWRTAAGAAGLQLLTTIPDLTTAALLDTMPDNGLGVAAPASSTATANRVDLSGIPIGAASVTARVIYRTAADQSVYKKLAQLADNTTTTYADTLSDATLTGTAPASDASGLAQPAGNVNPGMTELIVAGTGGFSSAGGWAVIGNGEQVIRYTGVTGSKLTGIPALGPGAIVASIAYNSTVTAAAELLGIPATGPGAIVVRLLRGDPINTFTQVDDLAAQATVAALFSSAAAGPHNGILEEVLQDRRLSITEARARGRAYLELRREVEIRVHCTVQDINARAGRTLHVQLGPPFDLAADFTIQQVTIANFHPLLLPTFAVEAASIKFSFEDLVRRLQARPEGS